MSSLTTDSFQSSWNVGLGLRTWIILLIVLGVRLIFTSIYRLFFHPLCDYPGPLFNKISSVAQIYNAIAGCDTYSRHEMHKKYGPIVRVGPNELAFADAASIKDIYGQSTEPCLKDPKFYDGITITGLKSVFSETNKQQHARGRRLLSHGFSQQAVLQYEPEIVKSIDKFLTLVSSAAQPVDLHEPAHSLFLDTASLLSLGKSFNLLAGEKHQGAHDIETYFSIAPLFGQFRLVKYVPFGLPRAAWKARPNIIRFCQSRINNFRSDLKSGKATNGLLKNMVEAKDEETGTRFTNEELIENMVIFIIAGSGTTATALLYLLYEVGKRPEMQRKLEAEIRTAFPGMAISPDFESANKLVYLNCILNEVLRLRGPITAAAYRLSPGKSIGGRYIQAGVTVSNPAYVTHRDPHVFPEPLRFDPDRWIDPTIEMKTMFRPFLTGPRNCIGMHLARTQILLAVCAIYQRFDVALDDRTTEDMMVGKDMGFYTPMGKQLWVRLVPVKDALR